MAHLNQQHSGRGLGRGKGTWPGPHGGTRGCGPASWADGAQPSLAAWKEGGMAWLQSGCVGGSLPSSNQLLRAWDFGSGEGWQY